MSSFFTAELLADFAAFNADTAVDATAMSQLLALRQSYAGMPEALYVEDAIMDLMQDCTDSTRDILN